MAKEMLLDKSSRSEEWNGIYYIESGESLRRKLIYKVIVPRGRIEDPPAPKIKIFSSAPAAGGCLPPLCNISALRNIFSILI